MKNVAIIVCFLCVSMGVHAQRQDSLATEKIICVIPQMPSFPGGSQALKDFISENLQWPKGHEEDCIQGRVVCHFKVQADGTCTDFKVLRSPLGEDFDAEALRVVKLMPKWIPGEMAGVPCSCSFALPISFKRE